MEMFPVREAMSHNEMAVGDEADESAEESLEEEETETSDAEDAIEAGTRGGQHLNPAHVHTAAATISDRYRIHFPGRVPLN